VTSFAYVNAVHRCTIFLSDPNRAGLSVSERYILSDVCVWCIRDEKTRVSGKAGSFVFT